MANAESRFQDEHSQSVLSLWRTRDSSASLQGQRLAEKMKAKSLPSPVRAVPAT